MGEPDYQIETVSVESSDMEVFVFMPDGRVTVEVNPVPLSTILMASPKDGMTVSKASTLLA